MHRTATMVAALAIAASARAQTGIAVVDSAAVARNAWRDANAALRAGDTLAARRAADRTVAAWPTQEAYAWGRAVVAVMLADTAGVVAALDRYAAMGFGRDVSADRRFAPFLTTDRGRAVAARVLANHAPLARSRTHVTFADSTFWPEGVDFDPRTGRFYVSSVRHRTIAEVAPNGDVLRELIARRTPGIGSILGVRVDTARDAVWFTTAGLAQMEGYLPADSAIAALVRMRLSTGAVERRFDLPPTPLGHTLGDLVVAPNGDVFATDSREPVLYRVRRGADTLERISHALFRSLQGITVLPGGALVVADWSHGLLRVDPVSASVTRIADAPSSSSLGVDGIAYHDGAIVGVQNGAVPPRIMRFAIDAAATRITRADVLDRNTPIADEPTIGTVVGDAFVYVANSQWEKYLDGGARRPGTSLARPVLLSVPLRRPPP